MNVVTLHRVPQSEGRFAEGQATCRRASDDVVLSIKELACGGTGGADALVLIVSDRIRAI